MNKYYLWKEIFYMENFLKNIPIRMCCACRDHKDKFELIKFVTLNNNIMIDQLYNKPGRGAYLCKNLNCFKKAKKHKLLDRALNIDIDQEIYDVLISTVFNHG